MLLGTWFILLLFGPLLPPRMLFGLSSEPSYAGLEPCLLLQEIRIG